MRWLRIGHRPTDSDVDNAMTLPGGGYWAAVLPPPFPGNEAGYGWRSARSEHIHLSGPFKCARRGSRLLRYDEDLSPRPKLKPRALLLPHTVYDA